MDYHEVERQAEKAVEYLAESEGKYAHLKALKELAGERLKITLASLKIETQASSDAKAETIARANPEYAKLVDEIGDILEEFHYIEAKRARANTAVEVWRSANSSRNRGNPI